MINKTKLALGITTALTIAAVLASPQAMAKKVKHHHVVTESSSSYKSSTTQNNNAKLDAMEAQMQAMQAEISRLRAESARPAASPEAGKVQELDQWMTDVKAGKAKVAAPKDHLFSVRGGWMHMNDNRGSVSGLGGSGLGTDILTSTVDKDAFYYGGAIDFNVNNDLFGLMDHTSFGIEFGVEYAEMGDRKQSGLTPAITAATGAAPASLQQSVTVNQLRINASPKIKFMHGSKFRPWLIPVGLDINIISPPSDAVTVLNAGMQFGAGAEYELLRGIVIGADGRYHHSLDNIDGVSTDGFTLGGSVGFKF